MIVRNFVLGATALLLAAPVLAQTSQDAGTADAPAYQIKVSRSRDDANVQSAPHAGSGPAAFYFFIDGGKTKGAEFGVVINGGTMDAYIVDAEKAWMSLPLENPYPGTIAQVRVGSDCVDSPAFLGRMLVTPDTPGGEVSVDIIPSMRAEQAVVLQCDFSVTQGFQAVPAAANADAPKAHEVRGVVIDAENAGTPTGDSGSTQ